MKHANIRYIVHDVDKAIEFYTNRLGFHLEMNPAPGFALLSKDMLRLFLNVPGAGGAGKDTPAGERPTPGGWNRFQLQFDDLAAEVERLRAANATFRSDMIEGNGGKQILLEDPSGNLIELFEPKAR